MSTLEIDGNPVLVDASKIRSIDVVKCHDTRAFRCAVVLCPEDIGGFSVYAPQLPGVVSQGGTVAECIDRITEALEGAIEEYLETSDMIPWSKVEIEEAPDTQVFWVIVHV